MWDEKIGPRDQLYINRCILLYTTILSTGVLVMIYYCLKNYNHHEHENFLSFQQRFRDTQQPFSPTHQVKLYLAVVSDNLSVFEVQM